MLARLVVLTLPPVPSCYTCALPSIRFKLISHRQDMVFVFIRGGLQTPRVVARSQVIHVTNPNEPLQGHLALTADSRQAPLGLLSACLPVP